MQRGFRSSRDRVIHPMARTAFTDAFELDPLNDEPFTHQRVEIDSASDDIPPGDAR